MSDPIKSKYYTRISIIGILSLWFSMATIGVKANGDILFLIKSFQIKGNSLIESSVIESALLPFLGENKRLEDVQDALTVIKSLYQKYGYGAVLVTIPEQELTDGVIHFLVTEPKLDQITIISQDIHAKEYFSNENILNALPSIRKDTVPSTTKIAENIQLSNENPAKKVEARLSVDETPEKINAKIRVDAQPPQKVFMTFDNTGTNTSGEWRMGFGYQNANLFNRDHVFTVNYITPPERAGDVNLYSLSYRLPFYQLGDSIDFIAARSDVGASTTQTVAGALQFAGNGDVLGLHYNVLLPRQGEYTHRLTAGIDYRSYDNSCSLSIFGSAGCGSGAASVAMLPASLSYVGKWAHPGQTLDFFVTGLHNIPGVPKGSSSDFAAVRPSPSATGTGANNDYYALRFGASFIQAFLGDWQLKLTGNAQYTSDSLVYAEQFGIAGSTTVRGFWEREVTRDQAYALNSEVYTPNVANAMNFAHVVRGVAFFDYGSGRNNTLKGEASNAISLASVGAGLRLGFTHSVQLKFDGAYVLNGATDHRTGDVRAHVSLYVPYSF